MPGPPRSLVAISLAALLVLAATRALESGAFIFAGFANGLLDAIGKDVRAK